MSSVLKEFDPEVVYHLAANSDISAGVADAGLDFGDTLMTTISVAQACQTHGVSQLIFASSSAIFGEIEGPISEHPTGFFDPVSWYGKAKLASEYVLESFSANNSNTAVLITRFPNVVGPLATHGVVFDFMNRLRKDPSHLRVLGNGFQEKPYVHVADLVEGIEHFRSRVEPGSLMHINLGPTDTITVREIVKEVTSVLKINPRVTYQDSATGWVGDIPKYTFDVALMKDQGFAIEASSRQAIHRAACDLHAEYSKS